MIDDMDIPGLMMTRSNGKLMFIHASK